MCLWSVMNHSEVAQVSRNKPTGVCVFYNLPPDDFAELRVVSASVRVDVIIIPFSSHIRLNLIPTLGDSTDLWFPRLATLLVMWGFFFSSGLLFLEEFWTFHDEAFKPKFWYLLPPCLYFYPPGCILNSTQPWNWKTHQFQAKRGLVFWLFFLLICGVGVGVTAIK